MTLARTQPRAIARGPEWQLRFLQHEAGSTANLYSFVESARLELDDFIRHGSLTASDASFFRALQREVASFARKLNAEGARWVEEDLPTAFDVGATTHAPHVVIPRGALEALSRNSLGLIRQIGDDARREIRHHVASGILSGISAQELRARIVSTGIGRGRWPSVEYRAGVIARTETMRAYNEGAIGGMTANGAAFARWIISPDEAVCPVCAPNAGVVFWLPGTRLPDGATDPYPAAKALPRIPRHPRCRCTVAAVYRDAEGRIIGAHVAPTAPASPPQIAEEPAMTPPAADDFETAAAKLGSVDFRITDPATAQFWRSIDMTPERRAVVAASDNQVLDDFLRARYGVQFAPRGAYDPILKRAIVDGLETYRGVRPEWVTDSEYLKQIGPHWMGPKALDGGVLGVAYADGRVAFDFEAIRAGKKYGSGPLRMGPNVAAADEVAVHEFAHTLHNRFGAHYKEGYGAVEFGYRRLSLAERAAMSDSERFAVNEKNSIANQQAEEWRAGWLKARRGSKLTAPHGELTPSEIEEHRRRLETIEAQVRAYESQIATGVDRYGFTVDLRFAKRELKKAQADADAIRVMLSDTGNPGGIEFYPTDYAKTNEFEDFAESVTMYMLNPARLRTYSPKRYAFIRDSVFGGEEFG